MQSKLLLGVFALLFTTGLFAQAETHTYTFDNGVKMDIQYLFEGPDFQPKFNIGMEFNYGFFGLIGGRALQVGLRGDYRLNADQKIIARFQTAAIPGLDEVSDDGTFTSGEALFQYTLNSGLKKVKRRETVHSESAGYNTTAQYQVKLPRRIRTKFNAEGGFSYVSGFNALDLAENATAGNPTLGDFSSLNLDLGLSLVRNKSINFKVEDKSASYRPFEFRAYVLASIGLVGNNTPRLGGTSEAPEADLSQFTNVATPEYNRFGWRLGMEWMSPSNWSFLGSLFRFEVGQMPGFTVSEALYDEPTGRLFFLATLGYNFYPSKPAKYSIPK